MPLNASCLRSSSISNSRLASASGVEVAAPDVEVPTRERAVVVPPELPILPAAVWIELHTLECVNAAGSSLKRIND